MQFDALEPFLRERLAKPLPGADVQRRFAPQPSRKNWNPDDMPDSARQAAALILLYPGTAGPALPLTVRQEDLPHHPGQVSLPGGRIDEGERAQDAALREAHEEIGIALDQVRLVGPLSPLWVIVSNFVVRPFIAVADARPEFRLAASEVAALVEVPLDEIRDSSRVKWMTRQRDGASVDYPYMDLAGHQVWGATAMMLGEFAALFDQ